MKLSRFALWLTFVVIISLDCYATVDQASLNEILNKAGLSQHDLGMLIEDENGRVFGINETQKFVPASLTKILTAGAVLQKLGPEFAFETQILTDGEISDRTLKGSIYLRSGGDPSFDSVKLKQLIGQFAKHKIKTIQGDIIVDDSRFDDPRFDNWDTVKGLIRSWNLHGYPLFVHLDPTKESLKKMRFFTRAERNLRTVLVSKNWDFVVYKNMDQPDLWTGYKMLSSLQQSKIQVKGQVKRGVVPAEHTVLSEIRSPLPAVVSKMMKDSNNYMAEVLTKNLAVEMGQKPATIEAGIGLIREFMDEMGIQRDDFHLTSAAGYSQLNSISAQTICHVLKHLKSSTISTSFIASMPVAGIDGTLKYRMRRTPAQGRVLAKTGHLQEAVGLAGYVSRPDGRGLTFAFMYNGPRSVWKVRQAFDRICVEMVK